MLGFKSKMACSIRTAILIIKVFEVLLVCS